MKQVKRDPYTKRIARNKKYCYSFNDIIAQAKSHRIIIDELYVDRFIASKPELTNIVTFTTQCQAEKYARRVSKALQLKIVTDPVEYIGSWGSTYIDPCIQIITAPEGGIFMRSRTINHNRNGGIFGVVLTRQMFEQFSLRDYRDNKSYYRKLQQQKEIA